MDRRVADDTRSVSHWRPAPTPGGSPQRIENQGGGGQHRAGRKRATHAKEARLAENEANRAEARAKEARALAEQASEFARQQQELSHQGRLQRVRVRVKKEKKEQNIAESPLPSSGPSDEEGEGEGEDGQDRDGGGWAGQQEEPDNEEGEGCNQPYDPSDPEQQYNPHDVHWVEKRKEMAGLLRYGKHRGRCISLQQSGWSSQADLAAAMQIPMWVVPAIADGSLDYKKNPRFIVRIEDGVRFLRPYFYQGSKVRNTQQHNSW